MIQHVGTMYEPPRFDSRDGYRFTCDACGYASPVMKHPSGAAHWRDWHNGECPATTEDET
jgi:hypothetical protein